MEEQQKAVEGKLGVEKSFAREKSVEKAIHDESNYSTETKKVPHLETAVQS
jgi:hypothetical protein